MMPLMNKWHSLGVQEKLHILIQGMLILVFVVSVQWVINRFDAQVTKSVQDRAMETADGLINGMNMLMLTGTVSNPDNRRLLLNKMAQSKGIRELRIIRAQQVSDQFGPGLPEEQAVDDLDRQVVASGQPAFQTLHSDTGAPMLRVVVPFIAQENFRGTNCLSCHHVKSGSVNGAASVTIDLSEEAASISEMQRLLWLGQLVLQLVLSVIIALFVRRLIIRNIARPVKELQLAMSSIRHDRDLSRRVAINENNADIGEMASTFNSLLEHLQHTTKRLDLFAQVFSNSGEAILITDAQRNIVTVNRAFTQITGYDEQDVVGQNPKMLSSGRQTPEFYREMWHAINETGQWRGEIWNRRKNGAIYPEMLSIGTVYDEAGKVTNYIAIFNDITQSMEAQQRILFLAHYDSLTSLPNRSLFDDRVQQALVSAKRNANKAALLFLDLDRFKSINDSLGHIAGDLLLQSVAKRLQSCVREMDTVCRRGGDEFMVLLPELERAEDVSYVAEKIIAAMAEPHPIQHQQLTVTFSIGISIYPDDGTDVLTLTKHADAAMYHAKEKGRNNFQFFTADMNAEAMERLQVEADLRKAIQNEEFVLCYQPQVDSLHQRIVGIEALIRWNHPEKGLVPPGKFIPIAEESGLIRQIGEWALNTACRQNKQWQDDELLSVPVAVNLSALQFYQRDIKEVVAKALAKSGLESGYLELEVTESTAMDDIEATVLLLNELKQMGVLISIDDFGTGYSSLTYLKRFPIDKLKIDQSFVRDIGRDADDAAIVQTIIGIGHSLRLKVIAEGVENMEQLAFLRNNGCDELQGYYFSKPLPPALFATYVKVNQQQKRDERLPWMMLYDSSHVALSEVQRQHVELENMVAIIEQVVADGVPDEIVGKMLDDLIVHAQMHFAAEEWLMELSNYPAAKAHIDEHRALLQEAGKLRVKMGDKVTPALVHSIKHWLMEHIQESDRRMSEHVKNSAHP